MREEAPRSGGAVAFEEVLDGARRGTHGALHCLYARFQPGVERYLARRGAKEADDLADDVFLDVFRNLSSFSGSEPEFRSWLFTIAYRRLVDERRRRIRLDRLEVARHCTASLQNVEDEIDALLAQDRARQLLSHVSAHQRDVLSLRFLQDLSVEEVASILGKTPWAVRALQHRGLVRLRRVLDDDGASS